MDYSVLEKNKNTLNTYDVFLDIIYKKIYTAKFKEIKFDHILISERAFYFLKQTLRERVCGIIISKSQDDKMNCFGEEIISSKQLEINEVKIVISDF